MLGTYLATVAVFAAAAVVGQAIFRACGHRAWSWLAPAVGMAALMPLAWWLVRLPGEGTTAGLLLIAIVLAAGAYLRGSVGGLGDAARIGLPVVAVALVAGSLPFIVEGRFGILGTGLNPDMSQHLFAADRLAESGSERLISSGYPLGPHSLAVAVSALGPSLVHAFDGIILATAVSAALAPLALLAGLPPARRVGGALLVGFAYMTAAYLTQGRSRRRCRRSSCWRSRSGWERPGTAAARGRGPVAVRSPRRARRRARSTSTASPGCSGSAAPRRSGRWPSSCWPAAVAGGSGRGGGPPGAAPGALRAGPVRARDRAGGHADRRLRRLRDLRSRGGGPRQPLQPALAAGGVGRLALGRLPARSRGRRRARDRLLPRRRAGLGRARLRAWWWLRRGERAVPARWPSPWRSVAYAARGRHPLPGGQGDRPRRSAGDAGQRPALAEAARRPRGGILRRRGIAALFRAAPEALRSLWRLPPSSPAPPRCAASPRSPTGRSGRRATRRR